MNTLQEMCLDAGLALLDEWIKTIPSSPWNVPGDKDLYIRMLTRLDHVPRNQFKHHWDDSQSEFYEMIQKAVKDGP